MDDMVFWEFTPALNTKVFNCKPSKKQFYAFLKVIVFVSCLMGTQKCYLLFLTQIYLLFKRYLKVIQWSIKDFADSFHSIIDFLLAIVFYVSVSMCRPVNVNRKLL